MKKVLILGGNSDIGTKVVEKLMDDKDLSYTLSLTEDSDLSKDHYPELVSLKNSIFDMINREMVDVNSWIRRNENLIPKTLFEYLERVLPVNIDISPGIVIGSHKLHRNKYYSHLGSDTDFPGTMKFFEGLLRLPIYPSMTDKECAIVTEAVKKVMKTIR